MIHDYITRARYNFDIAKHKASQEVRDYALKHTPLVPVKELNDICNALGDISIQEAVQALNNIQTEVENAAKSK